MSYPTGSPTGEVFLDARGNGRALRLTWHHEEDLVLLSLWRDDLCAGTFRLGSSDVTDFIDALVDGLRDAPGIHARRPEADSAGYVPSQRQDSPPDASMPATGQVAIGPSESTPQPQSFTDWAFGEGHRANVS